MLRLLNLFTALIISCSFLFNIQKVQAADSEGASLIFTELKARFNSSASNDYDEYIELYNSSSQQIDIAKFVLEYFNVTNPPAAQQPVQKPIGAGLIEPGAYLILARQPQQIENSLQSPYSSLADTGGRLRLVTTEGDVMDEIAWTNSQSFEQLIVDPLTLLQCNTSAVACSNNRVQSYVRQTNEAGAYYLNPSKWLLLQPDPHSDELTVLLPEESTPTEGETPVEDPVNQPDTTCEGMQLSEMLPNPDGADSGKEFIELFNPTQQPINLEGCSLQTSANTKKYDFEAIEIDPGQYVAFYDSLTGLTLNNSAGGTVWLLTPTTELDMIVYPGALEEDEVWNDILGDWISSFAPTPGAVNIHLPFKPCAEGQHQSDDGSCHKLVTTAVSSLAPCKPGQVRSLETNRCRSAISTAVAVLTPCKQGQERNPETNRCKNVASNNLAPCNEGEERNPDTNRCRKISDDSKTLAAVTDVKSETVKPGPAWWVVGLIILVGAGYAVYEWRQDISVWLRKQFSKFHK